jgi:hypothetical protein
MYWKKEITKMCIAFANAEDQSLTSEEREKHHEEYLHVRTNLLCELQLLHAHKTFLAGNRPPITAALAANEEISQ